LHALVFFRIATIAAHRLAEDRKSGALELLMATPLEVRRIVRGPVLRWIKSSGFAPPRSR